MDEPGEDLPSAEMARATMAARTGVLLPPLLAVLALAPLVAVLALALGAGSGCAAGRDEGAAPSPPSFLIVSIDTMRRDRLRAFAEDAPALPVLDALAARSARFRNAISSASWTLPAHASLLTGLYPDRHGATHPDRALSLQAFSLADAMRRAGYGTFAWVGSGYLDPKYGLGRGFERYAAGPEHAREGRDPTEPWGAVFARAVAFLSQPSVPTPFFVVTQSYRLHDFFHVRPETVAALGREPPELDRQEALDCLTARRTCTPADWELLRALYDQELRFVDRALGRVLERLDERGLRDTTYVFVLSDHGEGLEPQRERLSHGGRLHADVVRIPVLVSGPDVVPGDRSEPFSLIDVAPTVLELAGLAVPEGLDGRSAAPSLRGGSDVRGERALFALEHGFRFDAEGRRKARRSDGPALGVSVVRGDTWYIRGPQGEELYHMAEDPDQRRNQAQEETSERAALRALAAGHAAAPAADAPALRPPEEGLRRQLESLGYAR